MKGTVKLSMGVQPTFGRVYLSHLLNATAVRRTLGLPNTDQENIRWRFLELEAADEYSEEDEVSANTLASGTRSQRKYRQLQL